jgi:hypothetical protein
MNLLPCAVVSYTSALAAYTMLWMIASIAS